MSQLFTLESLENCRKLFLLISAGFQRFQSHVRTAIQSSQVRAEAERREREEEMRRIQAEQEKRRRALAWNGGDTSSNWEAMTWLIFFLPTVNYLNNIPTITYCTVFFWGQRKTKNRVGCVCFYCHNLHAASHGRYLQWSITIAVNSSVFWSPVMDVLTAWIGL